VKASREGLSLRLVPEKEAPLNAAFGAGLVLVAKPVTSGPSFGTKSTWMAAPKERRKLRREFRRKGYWAADHEVNGYPPGKRELAHEWLRQREIASDRRERWMIFAFIAVSIAAVVAAYFAAVQLKWL
jgi:hypothetical protein